jgi:hypothetical protein
MKVNRARTHAVVESRFNRSVNVELDLGRDSAVDGYVLTSTGRTVLQRVASALIAGGTCRAWSLTGPYGTGKSAFAVFVASLLSPSKSHAFSKATSLLHRADRSLAEGLIQKNGSVKVGLFAIPVTGVREPIEMALLRGLNRSVSHRLNGSGRSFIRDVQRAQESLRNGKHCEPERIVGFFADAVDLVCKGERGPDGVFLIIDELGRLVDFANSRPESTDLAVLQDLAEFAGRSSRPFLLMTIRHQDFRAYATNLSPVRRQEWEKIQGRFEDIAFDEPGDEMMRLIAKAMQSQKHESRLNHKSWRKLADNAVQMGLAPRGMEQAEAAMLMLECLPLHPIVVLMLGTVFRQLAQNERSAFSFLLSSEPFGLQAFLADHAECPDSLYGVTEFYEYLLHNLREAIYTSANAKRWAEVESLLTRLHGAGRDDVAIAQTIGLINAIGASDRIKASRDVVSFAVRPAIQRKAVEVKLDSLIKRSLIVERNYNGSLSLWEGSDVDIDAELRVARDRLDRGISAVELAGRHFQARPIVARRHSFVTGTLRFFPIRFCSLDDFDKNAGKWADPLEISVVLAENASSVRAVLSRPGRRGQPRAAGNIFCIPENSFDFGSQLRELAALEWIRANVKELEGDRTARREVDIRIDGVRRNLNDQLDRFLRPELGQEHGSRWFHGGKELRFTARHGLQEILSATCDDVYFASPRIQNELLNRRELSSAAAAARRNLIERMFQNRTEPNLGIAGTPPEMSMYLSLLHQGGLHRKGQSGWDFRAPPTNSSVNLRPAWDTIDEFFKDTESGGRSVSQLFDRLAVAPFGILRGTMPVLFCAALLVHEHEVALYKDGTFIPSPSTPDFELLMKIPDRYSVQRWRITGVRTVVFHRLADLLGRDLTGRSVGKSEILELIKPLLRFFSGLNEYTLHTRRVSAQASDIRRVLQKASQPDAMLFSDLPNACGVKPFIATERASEARVDEYVERLRSGLRDLQTAYDRLLETILELIRSSFAVDGDVAAARVRLSQRGAVLLGIVGEPILKSFLTRINQTELDDREWLEAIAGVVVIKPPAKWRDGDLDRFQQEIASLARQFRHVETLASAIKTGESTAEIVRIGVTTKDASDKERVVQLTAKQKESVDQLQSTIEETLKRHSSLDSNDVVLAALARVAGGYLD